MSERSLFFVDNAKHLRGEGMAMVWFMGDIP